MKYIPKQPEINVNVTPTSPLRDFSFMLGGVVLFCITIYILLGLAVDFMVPRISPETEKLLGKYLQAKWPRSVEYSEQEQQLQVLMGQIQGKCGNLPYQLEIVVTESEIINALAIPGGKVVVFTGLLENLSSENELTFVLGHEMGHFANRDHLSEFGRGLVFMTLSAGLFGPNSSIGNQIGKLLQVSELSFSRKHETMADEHALDIQNCVFGHVAGATDFFEHTSELEKRRFAGHYLSTHPEARERVANLINVAAQKGYSMQGKKSSLKLKMPEKKNRSGGD